MARKRMSSSRAHQVYRTLKRSMDHHFKKAIRDAQAAIRQSSAAKMSSAASHAREASFWASDLSIFLKEVASGIRAQA